MPHAYNVTTADSDGAASSAGQSAAQNDVTKMNVSGSSSPGSHVVFTNPGFEKEVTDFSVMDHRIFLVFFQRVKNIIQLTICSQAM